MSKKLEEIKKGYENLLNLVGMNIKVKKVYSENVKIDKKYLITISPIIETEDGRIFILYSELTEKTIERFKFESFLINLKNNTSVEAVILSPLNENINLKQTFDNSTENILKLAKKYSEETEN